MKKESIALSEACDFIADLTGSCPADIKTGSIPKHAISIVMKAVQVIVGSCISNGRVCQ